MRNLHDGSFNFRMLPTTLILLFTHRIYAYETPSQNGIKVIDIFTNYPNTDEILKKYKTVEESTLLNKSPRGYYDYDYYDRYVTPYRNSRYYYSDRRNYNLEDNSDILESEYGTFDHRDPYNYEEKYTYNQNLDKDTTKKPYRRQENPEDFKVHLNRYISNYENRPSFQTKNLSDQFNFNTNNKLAEFFHSVQNVGFEDIESSNEVQSDYGQVVTKPNKIKPGIITPVKRPEHSIKRPKPSDEPFEETTNINLAIKPMNSAHREKITNILRKYLVKMHQRKNGTISNRSDKKEMFKDHALTAMQTIGKLFDDKINEVETTATTNDETKEKFLVQPLQSIKNKTLKLANKFLSLFTVIQFPNFKCQATSALSDYEGTCYLASECVSLHGTAMGNCADGHGVCCVFRGTCGGIATHNCTYFESPGYPNYYPVGSGVLPPVPEGPTTTTIRPNTPDPRFQLLFRQGRADANELANALSCVFKVYKQSAEVKQIRIDFVDFELKGPINGQCVDERFVVSGVGLSTIVPVLCGYNTGQHIYVDVGTLSGPLQLAVYSTNIERKRFKLKICQFSNGCSGLLNCLQYYTGVNGVITSFNYEQAAAFSRSTPGHLNNLNYAVCIRREPGYCTVTYSVTSPTGVAYPFQLRNYDDDGQLAVPNGQAGVGVINCPDDYIIINGIRLCGDKLNDGSVSADFSKSAPVTDLSAGPIILPVRTNAFRNGRGFKLFYTQQRCGSMLAGGVPDPRI